MLLGTNKGGRLQTESVDGEEGGDGEGRREVDMKTIIAMVVCGVIGIAVGHGQGGAARGAWHRSQQETQKPEEKPAAKSGDAGQPASQVKPTAESLALGKRF